MSLQPIPPDWCKTVCELLRKGGPRLVTFEPKGRMRWEAEFPSGMMYELEKAFRDTLSQPGVAGCPVQMSFPTGDTWDFYFTYKGHKLYGKILLYPAKNKVLIFSAHHPDKPTLRCE
ncbi:MAG: hypothetical protein H7067_06875 [Burkholderiales bacterium]|nr:hypothetical protein [Opitutaceae bacterium]